MSPSRGSPGSLSGLRVVTQNAVQSLVVITVRCECGAEAKIDVAYAKEWLRAQRAYSFGDHVSDGRAFVIRALTLAGWIYIGGRLGKTALTMTCPVCREKLPGLPVDPEDQSK